MKKRYILLIICSVLFILFIIIMMFTATQGVEDAKIMQADSLTSSNIIPADYIGLFKKKNAIISLQTTNSKARNAIVDLYYENKYCVEIYKIDSNVSKSLKDIIDENYQDTHVTLGAGYHSFNDAKPFDIEYKTSFPDKVNNKIFFNFFGNDTRVIEKEDSIASYYSNFKNLSVQFDKSRAQDIFAQPKTDNSFMPVNISFLKKQNDLFFIILTAKDKKNQISPNTLSEILSK